MIASARPYIRSAKPADREAVLRFCENTWEWGDYIPLVWNRWLHEPASKALVATMRSQPVAFGHVIMVAPGEAWLEGLRVDPVYHQKGLATRLTQYLLVEAAKLGAGVARFATSSKNIAVHRMSAKFSFTEVAAILPLHAEATGMEHPLPYRPKPQALPNLLSFLEGSTVMAAMGGLYSTGWRFHSLNHDRIRESLNEGVVRIIGGPDIISALAIVEPGYPGEGLAVRYADGQIDALIELAYELRVEAASYEPPQVSARLPDIPQVQQAFQQAGYKPQAENPFWIYQQVLGVSSPI